MHNAKAFAAISHLTVGGFRDWLLSDDATQNVLGGVAPGVTPEMAAAVSKICCAQDLLLIAAKCIVTLLVRSTMSDSRSVLPASTRKFHRVSASEGRGGSRLIRSSRTLRQASLLSPPMP